MSDVRRRDRRFFRQANLIFRLLFFAPSSYDVKQHVEEALQREPSEHVHIEQRYEFAAEFYHVKLVESKIQQGYKLIKPLQDQGVLKMFVSFVIFPFRQVDGDRAVCHIENYND